MQVDSPQFASDSSVGLTRHFKWRQFARNDPNAPEYRARMLQSMLKLGPYTMGANALNALILTWAFADDAGVIFGLLWLALVILQIIHGLRTWHVTQKHPRRRASVRSIKRATIFAFLQGLTWGLAPATLYSSASPDEQIILAVISTVMLCAGAFALSPIRPAAIAYCVTLGSMLSGSVLTSSSDSAIALGMLLSAYVALVVAAIYTLSNNVVSRLMAETQGEKQRMVIGLLLRDFEEHASDILWEIDEHGMLRHASPRLLAVLGIAENATDSLPFHDLLRRKSFNDREGSIGMEQLHAVLGNESPFRDLSLKLAINGETRWWTITAKPLTNDSGKVIGWRGILADVTESRTTHESLVRLAHHCSLTGLANRHHFVTRLAEDLQRLAIDRHLAVLYVDLDDFKKVNDSFGHAYGDKLLRNIADRLQETVRADDLVARLGGDEFAVLLHDVHDKQQAMSYARRLLEHVEPAYQVNGSLMPVGMSVGVALAPWHGERPDELMRAADLAMYSAKSGGKGTVAFYTPEMGEMSRRKRLLEEGLRTAIDNGELDLVYQPQVALDSGQITAFEALLRWNHPSLGPITPDEFIPIAEETGQIESIGRWVMHKACMQAREWPNQIGVAVNVSAAQAMAEDLLDTVKQALSSSALNVRRLELEITESIFLDDNPSTLRVLHSLRDLGAKIALDDFGVGYSSLGYLRRFPFSSLKIDRAFTQEIVTSEQSRSIIRAIVALARTMGMTIIAEGVERPEQVDILNRLGADWAQGYMYAAPVSADQVPDLLANWRPQAIMSTLQTGDDRHFEHPGHD